VNTIEYLPEAVGNLSTSCLLTAFDDA